MSLGLTLLQVSTSTAALKRSSIDDRFPALFRFQTPAIVLGGSNEPSRGNAAVPLYCYCLLKCIFTCTSGSDCSACLTHSLMKRRIVLYIHHVTQYTHTFTRNLGEELSWLKASYLFYFKHVHSESLDLAFRDADAKGPTALPAFLDIKMS